MSAAQQGDEVSAKMRTLVRQPVETAIIERYRRREVWLEKALIEMHLADVPVRRVEDISEALRGTRVCSGTVSGLDPKVYKYVEARCRLAIENEFPYVASFGYIPKTG